MRRSFETQQLAFGQKNTEMHRERIVSEQYGARAYPPRTQEAARNQRRRLTEEYLARRNKTDVLDMPERLDATNEIVLGNQELPAYEKKQEIIDAVLHNQVTIIVGETGSGKSTQIPQFLLEAGLRPSMTQPRIMAANGVAERVIAELGCHFGEEDADALVGVQTSERNTVTELTRVTVVTDGVRLAQELNERGDIVDEVVIIDEVHEHNVNIDIILALLKRLVAEKPGLRIVIMSATTDVPRMVKYFADVTDTEPQVIEIKGRQFEVTQREEPGSTVAKEVIKEAETAKSILVFVPGVREVNDTIDAVAAGLPEGIRETASLFPLHAKMSKAEQDKVYQDVPGLKVIVATNVAQTSLTISGVDTVVDSGLERRQEMDDEDILGLLLRDSSKDNCKQRRGRTGRDVPGTYVLTRYDEKTPFVSFSDRDEHTPAPILHTNLASNVLQTAAYGIDFAELDLYTQVDAQAIQNAKRSLFALQALDENENITAIGKEMSKYTTLSPRYSRMMVEATRPGVAQEVGVYLAAISASIEAGGLQRFAYEVETRWRTVIREETESDPFAQLDIFMATLAMDTEDESYLDQLIDLDLDPKNVSRAHNQYRKVCKIIGVDSLTYDLRPPTPEQVEAVKDCMYVGMVENVFKKTGRNSQKKATYTPLESNTVRTPRSISSRSIVKSESDVILCDPRRFEKYKDGGRVVEHIAENVLPVELQKLAGVAMHLCKTELGDFSLRGNTVVQRRNKLLYGEMIDDSQEVSAEWSPELKEFLVQNALENPGPSQKELRMIKKELEELQRLTAETLPLITQSDLEEWVRTAADEQTLSPSQLDHNIRLRMLENGMSIESIVNSARYRDIYDNAPEYIDLGYGAVVRVNYQGQKPPFVKLSDVAGIEELPDRPQLPDGREVYVRVAKSTRGVNYLPVAELKYSL